MHLFVLYIVDRPTLMISKPYDRTWPQLHVGVTNRREQKPTVHIYKWHSNRGAPTRPGLSIEQQIHNSWNDRSHGSTGLQIGVGSSSSLYGYSNDDSASRINRGPLNIASSSSGRVYTSEGARSRAQSWRSFERPSEGFSAEDCSEGTSISDYKDENSVARVNAQASGNAHGIALSVGESFVRFPDENARTISLHRVKSNDYKQKQSDSDILSDFAQTVGELLDIV